MKSKYLLILILGLVVLPCCSVTRESICASINNTIGVTVAQNEKSQCYEAKAGYIRSQFYLIPTGKIIEKGPGGELQSVSAQANVAPEIVSAANVESGVEQLFIGIKSKELFAVGQYGVQSPAAVAMFLANPSGNQPPDQVGTAAAAILEQTPNLPPSPPNAVSPAQLTAPPLP